MSHAQEDHLVTVKKWKVVCHNVLANELKRRRLFILSIGSLHFSDYRIMKGREIIQTRTWKEAREKVACRQLFVAYSRHHISGTHQTLIVIQIILNYLSVSITHLRLGHAHTL